jgi:hypothetical protein
MGGRMSHPVEVEWGTDVFAGLTVATLLMCITGWVTFDLVRTMWSGNPPLGPTNSLLQMVSGFFG